jgi:hypothetical protein
MMEEMVISPMTTQYTPTTHNKDATPQKHKFSPAPVIDALD